MVVCGIYGRRIELLCNSRTVTESYESTADTDAHVRYRAHPVSEAVVVIRECG